MRKLKNKQNSKKNDYECRGTKDKNKKLPEISENRKLKT